MPTIKPPNDLADAGKAFWSDVTSRYDLRPDELRVLVQACKTLDMIAKLEAKWVERGEPDLSEGSMGQEVIHPLIGELRAQRAAFERLRAALKLPDVSAEPAPAEDASAKARRAAAARWSRGA